MKTTLLFLSVFLSASLFGQIPCATIYDINGQEICIPEYNKWTEFLSRPKDKEEAVAAHFEQNERPLGLYYKTQELIDFSSNHGVPKYTPSVLKVYAQDEFQRKEFLKQEVHREILIQLSNVLPLVNEEDIQNIVKNNADRDMTALHVIANSIFNLTDSSVSVFFYFKNDGMEQVGSLTYFNCRGTLISVKYTQGFKGKESLVSVKNQTKLFLSRFIEANSSDNSKNTSNTYEAMNNLIGKDSIDENEICASNMKLGLKESYGIEINQKDAETYCRCVFEGLAAKDYGLTLNKSAKEQMLEKDSPVYNEVAMTCLKPILISMGIIDKEETSEDDVYGNKSVSEVKLLEDFDETLKLKIKIGGIEKYFLFDTGASNLVIDEKLEAVLLKKNVIRQEDYKGTTLVSFADNSSEECRVVNLSQIEIGGYTLKNVETIILKGGALLCGQSLLNKFKKYNFDSNRNVLILEKNK